MSALDEMTDRLNEALEDVEDALADLKLGVTAQVQLGTDGLKLKFGKSGADWVLTVIYPEGAPQALLSAGRAVRVQAVQCLPALLAALREAHALLGTDVEQALDAATQFAADVRDGAV